MFMIDFVLVLSRDSVVVKFWSYRTHLGKWKFQRDYRTGTLGVFVKNAVSKQITDPMRIFNFPAI